jgi:enoyl-CoA hydratase/carnithine racemase
MNDRIACDVTAGVADVRLMRADKMNALDEAMFLALLEVGERLATEAGLRAVVLSGEGRAFCAGLDMASFANMASPSAAPQEDRLGLRTLKARTHGLTNSVQQVAWQWRELAVPVIAAAHGVAFGGGFQIMLGADLRYAAPDTKFSVMEIKWGLVPDMAGTQLMRHLARDDVVRELTYTGRVFAAEEALAHGFVTRLAQPCINFRCGNRVDCRIGRTAGADRFAEPARGGDGQSGKARRPLRRCLITLPAAPAVRAGRRSARCRA